MSNPRVVVADDYAETRARIVRLLESQFDVVATVADGQAAVEACGALHPDVVVLDITMPVLCGYSSDRVGTGAGFDAICDQHSHVVGESRT